MENQSDYFKPGDHLTTPEGVTPLVCTTAQWGTVMSSQLSTSKHTRTGYGKNVNMR